MISFVKMLAGMTKVINADLLVEIEKSKQNGRITEALAGMFVCIAERLINPPHFKRLTYNEDMKQQAIMQIMISYRTFDPTKNDNVFGYLVAAARSALIKFLHEGKNHEIM